MRLEGFVPIPYSSMSSVYLFGTGLFKPGTRATIASPYLLDAAPTGKLPTDPNAVVISTPQADRDYYRVGVGVDVGVDVGVPDGVTDGVEVGVPPGATTKCVLVVVERVRKSIVPEATTCERSTVDVVTPYCTDVPAGWAGITAE